MWVEPLVESSSQLRERGLAFYPLITPEAAHTV